MSALILPDGEFSFACPLLCAHCRGPVNSRGPRRGLCRACERDPELRRRYPCTGTLAGRGRAHRDDGDFTGPAPLPPRADIPPGPGKESLLAQRAAARQSLFRADEPHIDPTGLARLAARLKE